MGNVTALIISESLKRIPGEIRFVFYLHSVDGKTSNNALSAGDFKISNIPSIALLAESKVCGMSIQAVYCMSACIDQQCQANYRQRQQRV